MTISFCEISPKVLKTDFSSSDKKSKWYLHNFDEKRSIWMTTRIPTTGYQDASRRKFKEIEKKRKTKKGYGRYGGGGARGGGGR